ncbi:MAG: hypothetical protein ACFBZ8_04485 [Opitutales bacterium]
MVRRTCSLFWLLAGFALSACLPSLQADEKIFIAVVGGSSFGAPDKFGEGLVETDGFEQVETPFGPGPKLYKLRYKGVPFYYVRFYGYETLAQDNNDGNVHVRTWYSLHKKGVTHVLGGATSGGIRTDYDYDDIIIADDFMVMESQRPQSILDYTDIERPGIFPNFATPFSPSLRTLLIDEAQKAHGSYSGNLYTSGVHIQHNPGRFETAAEIRAMRILGADHVSENVGTCTTYARQLGMRWAVINAISNPAVGVRPFSFKDMQGSTARVAAHCVPILLETIARIPEEATEPEPVSEGEKFQGSYTDPDSESSEIISSEE